MTQGLRSLKDADGWMLPFTTANPTSQAVKDFEVHRARCRPADDRTPMPQTGQRVWYRHDWHVPLSAAQIVRVDLENREDWNVYRYVLDYSHVERRPVEVDGKRVVEMVDDPWPDVVLRTDYGMMVTREARIQGSPGWLPMRED